MIASLFATGTSTAPIAGPARGDAGNLADVCHAVAKPLVDGLESSVCGLLVTASAADDWQTLRDAARCEECSRIAG